jgi:hypothetical protein
VLSHSSSERPIPNASYVGLRLVIDNNIERCPLRAPPPFALISIDTRQWPWVDLSNWFFENLASILLKKTRNIHLFLFTKNFLKKKIFEEKDLSKKGKRKNLFLQKIFSFSFFLF